ETIGRVGPLFWRTDASELIPTTSTSPNFFAASKLRTWPTCKISKQPCVATMRSPPLCALRTALSTSLNGLTLLRIHFGSLYKRNTFVGYHFARTLVGKADSLVHIIGLDITHHQRGKERVARAGRIFDIDLLDRVELALVLGAKLATRHDDLFAK